jgi:uncharacterized SAM-binding protein YcdF (DUF218 family)
MLYVAHPSHVFRVMEMAKRFKTLEDSLSAPFIEGDIGAYDPDDCEWFARGRNKFAMREVLVRMHHKLCGRI